MICAASKRKCIRTIQGQGDLGILKAQVDLYAQGLEVDLYCVYCPDADECYYLNPANADQTQL
jgi:hypothetical protein